MTKSAVFESNSIVPAGQASYTQFTRIEFAPSAKGQLIYPGRVGRSDVEHNGYVRTRSKMETSRRVRLGERIDSLPFRDYPDTFRTPVREIHKQALDVLGVQHAVVIPTRNVDNELTFQARIGGKWCRRADDGDVPGHYPVLRLPRNKAVGFCSFSEAQDTEDDLLTGLPLVIDGSAVSREFIIASASDIAWSYAVDPGAAFGPPSPAWERISNRWQELRDLRFPDADIARALDDMARIENQKGKQSGRRTIDPPGAHALPHSILAWRNGLNALVVSSTLWGIASFLSKQGFESAFVLDQSGSTQYSFLRQSQDALPIVGSSNWRDSGTCFLAIETGNWLWSAPHFALQV
jgi:hypothetical protein